MQVFLRMLGYKHLVCQLHDAILLQPIAQRLVATDAQQTSSLLFVAVRLCHASFEIVACYVGNDFWQRNALL